MTFPLIIPGERALSVGMQVGWASGFYLLAYHFCFIFSSKIYTSMHVRNKQASGLLCG